MRIRPGGLAVFAGAAAPLAATSAKAAEADGLSIDRDAPAACPDDSAVRVAIRRWMALTPGTVESAAVKLGRPGQRLSLRADSERPR
jgi:hypothetical protein